MKLVKGEGSRETGACWMSAIAWYAGQETWTDKAECVDPLIRGLCIWLNDRLPSDEERELVIGPHIMAPMGTRTDDPDVLQRRRERVVGFAFDAATKALHAAGLTTEADKLAQYGGTCPCSEWDRANAAANDAYAYAAYAADRGAIAAANAAIAAAYAAANAGANADAAAANAAYAYVYAARGVVRAATLGLILELCAIGTPTEVPQVRSMGELV